MRFGARMPGHARRLACQWRAARSAAAAMTAMTLAGAAGAQGLGKGVAVRPQPLILPDPSRVAGGMARIVI